MNNQAPSQMSLFSSVLHAYSNSASGSLGNRDLYERVAQSAGISEEVVERRVPIGRSGEMHSPFKRKVRWCQQSLRTAGILQHVEGERGLWELTKPTNKELNEMQPDMAVLGFSTELGIAILGSCDHVFSNIDAPIQLILTSPPYPLTSARRYGNVDEAQYTDWICKVLEPLVKNMLPGASMVLNISNDVFLSKSPARSMYCERVLLALHDRLGLQLMDRLIWENPQKPPGPFQYASKTRQHLNTAWEPCYWLSNDPVLARSNNRRVLQPHSEQHLKLIQSGGEKRTGVYSDGAYRINPGSFGNATEGRIPKNILRYGHRCASQSAYKRAAHAAGLPAHGAPMPLSLAKFLVEFLTEPGDLVAEPFGGSLTTALAAESLGRHWIATEIMAQYMMGARFRFKDALGYQSWMDGPTAQESLMRDALQCA